MRKNSHKSDSTDDLCNDHVRYGLRRNGVQNSNAETVRDNESPKSLPDAHMGE
ncbi:hypothetical protein D3C85_1554350 [compost metagenome]